MAARTWSSIAQRFETGRIGASDAIRVIGAGLRGAGNAVTDEEVSGDDRRGRGRRLSRHRGAAPQGDVRMTGRFPWDDFMRLGLGVLKLSPAAFWAATPREIAAAFPRARRDVPGARGAFLPDAIISG
jgi:uncharacterized phage protein (TIGR02216 family)